MRQIATLLLALMLALGAGTATISCSSQTTTTRTVDRPSEDGMVKRETATTETTDDSGPHFGILSGTVKAIGFVLSLPFKLVGGLFSIVF